MTSSFPSLSLSLQQQPEGVKGGTDPCCVWMAEIFFKACCRRYAVASHQCGTPEQSCNSACRDLGRYVTHPAVAVQCDAPRPPSRCFSYHEMRGGVRRHNVWFFFVLRLTLSHHSRSLPFIHSFFSSSTLLLDADYVRASPSLHPPPSSSSSSF